MKNRIKCIRKSRRLSQTAFAQMLNVDQTAVSNWETYKNGIDTEIAMRISELFLVPVEFVLGREFETSVPVSSWSRDQIEDMNSAHIDAKDFFLFVYGKGYFKHFEDHRQVIQDNHGIIGNTHAPVTINGSADQALGDIEKELLSICSRLDMKRKNALLAKAYDLLEE